MSLSGRDMNKIPGFYQHEAVKPECRPFYIENGSKEVIIFFHGLTGSPHDYRQYIQAYSDAGYDIVAPLLPGHGSHISHLERLSFRELYIPFEPLTDYLRPNYERLHLVGLSYGAVLTAKLALSRAADSVSFLAPAFFLTTGSEKNMRIMRRFSLHRFKSRISKKQISGKTFKAHPFTYAHIPFLPAMELHERAQEIMTQMEGVNWRVFHGHGDQDATTPIDANHTFLRKVVKNYTFYHLKGGAHVLPLADGADAMAAAHISWLQESS